MSINPKNFGQEYYYNICFGSEEFKKSNGRSVNPRIKKMIDDLKISSSMDVLDIGCGRGDMALYIAKKARSVNAIDYSKEGIVIANKIRNLSPKAIKEKTKFHVMDATKLQFLNNSFDLVILIDTLDHLNTKEQISMMNEIRRVLKPNGKLFIRTCANRILLSSTYKYYIHPMNKLLTWIDMKIKGVNYPTLPDDPRSKEQKKQHINESDYFKLVKLFKKTNFKGEIKSEVGFLKEGSGLRTKLYNFILTFYPFSKHFPLNILFTGSFTCFVYKNKD